jgi:transposase
MGRPIEVVESFEKENFLELAKKQAHAKAYTRFLALHHIQEGSTYVEAGQKVGAHWRSVQDWVKRYNLNGIEGIKYRKPAGQKPVFDEVFHAEFKKLIEEAQSKKTGGRLKGEDAQRLLKEHFSISYSLSSTYRCLHLVGLSWVTGRDCHPSSNKETQEEFKKNLIPYSKNKFLLTSSLKI